MDEMQERVLDQIEEKLKRIEDKLDILLDKQHSQDTRLTHLEAQAGFVRTTLAVLGTVVLTLVGLAVEWLKK